MSNLDRWEKRGKTINSDESVERIFFLFCLKIRLEVELLRLSARSEEEEEEEEEEESAAESDQVFEKEPSCAPYHFPLAFPAAFLFFVLQEPGPVLLPAPGPPGLVQEPRQRQEGQGAESPGPPLGERPRPRLLLLRALLQRPRVRRRVRTARLKRSQRLPIRQGEWGMKEIKALHHVVLLLLLFYSCCC